MYVLLECLAAKILTDLNRQELSDRFNSMSDCSIRVYLLQWQGRHRALPDPPLAMSPSDYGVLFATKLY